MNGPAADVHAAADGESLETRPGRKRVGLNQVRTPTRRVGVLRQAADGLEVGQRGFEAAHARRHAEPIRGIGEREPLRVGAPKRKVFGEVTLDIGSACSRGTATPLAAVDRDPPLRCRVGGGRDLPAAGAGRRAVRPPTTGRPVREVAIFRIVGELGDGGPNLVDLLDEASRRRGRDGVDLVLREILVVGDVEVEPPVEQRELEPIVAALADRIGQEVAVDAEPIRIDLEIVRLVVAEAQPGKRMKHGAMRAGATARLAWTSREDLADVEAHRVRINTAGIGPRSVVGQNRVPGPLRVLTQPGRHDQPAIPEQALQRKRARPEVGRARIVAGRSGQICLGHATRVGRWQRHSGVDDRKGLVGAARIADPTRSGFVIVSIPHQIRRVENRTGDTRSHQRGRVLHRDLGAVTFPITFL